MVVALLAACFAVSRSCQQDQVRITKEQAVATAEERVRFDPTRVQVRMIRQGIESRPMWAVSLSVPRANGRGFAQLAVVRVNANTGKVASIATQR